jgi:hypothetical protein
MIRWVDPDSATRARKAAGVEQTQPLRLLLLGQLPRDSEHSLSPAPPLSLLPRLWLPTHFRLYFNPLLAFKDGNDRGAHASMKHMEPVSVRTRRVPDRCQPSIVGWPGRDHDPEMLRVVRDEENRMQNHKFG